MPLVPPTTTTRCLSSEFVRDATLSIAPSAFCANRVARGAIIGQWAVLAMSIRDLLDRSWGKDTTNPGGHDHASTDEQPGDHRSGRHAGPAGPGDIHEEGRRAVADARPSPPAREPDQRVQ